MDKQCQKKIIIQRTRIFFAVEGEGEQSLIKFLQQLSGQNGLHVHLDYEVLSGGGYKTMLERAISCRTRNEKKKGKSKESILIVDTDCAEKQDDPWTLDRLTNEADEEFYCLHSEAKFRGLTITYVTRE